MTIKGVYDVNQLASEINKILREYSDGVGEKLSTIAEKIAKDGAKKLKVVGDFEGHRVNGYRKGWRAKVVNDKWVVHNATNYQLTHLLEHGHALKRGGRKIGDTRAFEHIRKVEQEMIDEYVRQTEEVLKG